MILVCFEILALNLSGGTYVCTKTLSEVSRPPKWDEIGIRDLTITGQKY